MYEVKTEDVYEGFSKEKKMFDFSNYSNKLAVGKTKDETGSVATREFVGLKPKTYSFFVDDSSEHKKSKGMNKMLLKQ